MIMNNNIRKMIRSYFGLLIFFVLQHQVPSLTADVEQIKQTQNVRKYMMTELQNVQRRTDDISEDPLDNYDLIVTQHSESLTKPRRLRHGYHGPHSGRGSKFIKNDTPHKHLKLENTLRKNFNPTEETYLTQIQSDANATTRNYLDDHDRGRENGVTTQKEKDTAMGNDLSEQRRGIENETTTEKQIQANVATIPYDNEPQESAEEKSSTTIQKDKNVTKNVKKTYLSENTKEREIEATTKIQRNKDSTKKNYLNEHQREETQIQSKQSAVMKNNLNGHRNKGENKAMTQINKNGKITNFVIENWREEEKIATTSQKPVKTKQNVTPKVPFYRRINYLNDQERNKPQKWVHCLDLVTPRLKGYTDNGRAIAITSRSSIIKRLVELLTTDITKYTEAEIIALLSQISNIDFRLFQWHFSAITTIINIIIQEPVHSFRKLKAGIKFMFRRWHLDTSMMKTFLEQTRIIRPPCIDISGMSDFTKKGGSILFTKPDKPTKKPRGGDESCHSQEITTVNNNND